MSNQIFHDSGLLKFLAIFQGAHVSINARNEDEVDEKVILSKVAKASGSNYSFHKEERKAVPAAEPVVCMIRIFDEDGKFLIIAFSE